MADIWTEREKQFSSAEYRMISEKMGFSSAPSFLEPISFFSLFGTWYSGVFLTGSHSVIDFFSQVCKDVTRFKLIICNAGSVWMKRSYLSENRSGMEGINGDLGTALFAPFYLLSLYRLSTSFLFHVLLCKYNKTLRWNVLVELTNFSTKHKKSE